MVKLSGALAPLLEQNPSSELDDISFWFPIQIVWYCLPLFLIGGQLDVIAKGHKLVIFQVDTWNYTNTGFSRGIAVREVHFHRQVCDATASQSFSV